MRTQLDHLLLAHTHAVSGMTRELNPYTHPELLELSGPLTVQTESFHAEVDHIATMAAKGLEADVHTARYRLGNATAQIMEELQSEAEQEAEEKAAHLARSKDQGRGAQGDVVAAWEGAAAKGKGRRATRDERDVDAIIEAFEAKIRTMRGPFLASAELIDEGQALVARVRDETTTDVALLEKAFVRIVEMMDAIGYVHDQNLESQRFVDQFEELLHESRFVPLREEVLLKLQGWHAGQITSTMLMLHMEKLISKDQLAVEWFQREDSGGAGTTADEDEREKKKDAEAKIQEAVLGLGW